MGNRNDGAGRNDDADGVHDDGVRRPGVEPDEQPQVAPPFVSYSLRCGAGLGGQSKIWRFPGTVHTIEKRVTVFDLHPNNHTENYDYFDSEK